MRAVKVFLFLSFCVFFAPPVFARDDGGEKLLKIVALSRHGVRAPTQDAKILTSWSQKTWPDWPVAKGELTPRGARLVTAMWADIRPKFNAAGLLPENQCPRAESVYVRADTDERTKATAVALLDGLAPDCGLGYAAVDDKIDPLFHPVKAGLYCFNPIDVATDVLTMTDGGLDALAEDFAGPLNLTSRIIGAPSPSLCARFTMTPNCRLEDLPNAISVSPDGRNIRLVGSLSMASSLAEIFLLEYGEWPGVDAGWGQVNAAVLSQLLPVHAKIFDVINRTPLVAWARGSSLLTEIAASLNGDNRDARCNEARFVAYVGHDTNIANIGALLGLNWRFGGYPENGIPPASVLMFELWDSGGKRVVKVTAYAQSPKALHAPFDDENSPLPSSSMDRIHAPSQTLVTAPPIVGQAIFDLDAFMDRVTDITEGAPLAPKQTPKMRFKDVTPKP